MEQQPWMRCVIDAAKRHSATDWAAMTDEQRSGHIATQALRMIYAGDDGTEHARRFARGVLHAMRIDGL